MKLKQLLWGLLCVLCSGLPYKGMACDGGCPTVGNYQNGLFPNFHKHYIGLIGRYSTLNALHGHDGSTGQYMRDQYYSLSLQARVYPHPRVQLLAFLPYNIHQQQTADNNWTQLQGVGDASVLAFYQMYNNKRLDSSAVNQHNVLLGGGIKLPTGQHQAIGTDGLALPIAFQLGTGAWSFLLSGAYTWRRKKWGANLSSTYQINTTNAQGYQLGNQWSSSLDFFGVFKAKQWTIAPQVGGQVENLARNKNRGFDRLYSGGTQLLATASINLYYKNLQLGLQGQCPVWQQMASGQVHQGMRLNAQINYLF